MHGDCNAPPLVWARRHRKIKQLRQLTSRGPTSQTLPPAAAAAAAPASSACRASGEGCAVGRQEWLHTAWGSSPRPAANQPAGTCGCWVLNWILTTARPCHGGSSLPQHINGCENRLLPPIGTAHPATKPSNGRSPTQGWPVISSRTSASICAKQRAACPGLVLPRAPLKPRRWRPHFGRRCHVSRACTHLDKPRCKGRLGLQVAAEVGIAQRVMPLCALRGGDHQAACKGRVGHAAAHGLGQEQRGANCGGRAARCKLRGQEGAGRGCA